MLSKLPVASANKHPTFKQWFSQQGFEQAPFQRQKNKITRDKAEADLEYIF